MKKLFFVLRPESANYVLDILQYCYTKSLIILILLIWWNDMPELDSRVRNILLVLIIISKTHIGTHNRLQDRQPIII